MQYLPLTVGYTEAQCAGYLSVAPADMLPTMLHLVLYPGRPPCVGCIDGFPHPLASSLVRPQGSTHRRSEDKRRVGKGYYFLTPSLFECPGWAASFHRQPGS